MIDYSHFNPRAHMSVESYRVQSHQDNSRSGIRSHTMKEWGVSGELIVLHEVEL